ARKRCCDCSSGRCHYRRSERMNHEERVCLRRHGVSRRKTMNDSGSDKTVCLALLAILFSSSAILFGGPEPLATHGKHYSKEVRVVEKGWCESPPLWEIRIGAPGWLGGISGDSGVKGVVDSADVSFSQLFRHLTHVPIVLSADFHYKRWELFGDGQYMEVGASASLPGLLFTNANVHLKDGLAEGFLGYR